MTPSALHLYSFNEFFQYFQDLPKIRIKITLLKNKITKKKYFSNNPTIIAIYENNIPLPNLYLIDYISITKDSKKFINIFPIINQSVDFFTPFLLENNDLYKIMIIKVNGKSIKSNWKTLLGTINLLPKIQSWRQNASHNAYKPYSKGFYKSLENFNISRKKLKTLRAKSLSPYKSSLKILSRKKLNTI